MRTSNTAIVMKKVRTLSGRTTLRFRRFLLHDNASPHTTKSPLIRLASTHPSYPPGLPPSHFWLFRSLQTDKMLEKLRRGKQYLDVFFIKRGGKWEGVTCGVSSTRRRRTPWKDPCNQQLVDVESHVLTCVFFTSTLGDYSGVCTLKKVYWSVLNLCFIGHWW